MGKRDKRKKRRKQKERNDATSGINANPTVVKTREEIAASLGFLPAKPVIQ